MRTFSNGNIKSAVSDWTTSPTTATTKYGDIGGWNVAAVTNMYELFEDKPAFDQNIGRWNEASVSTMDSMFSYAAAFNQNIASWNPAKVRNMNSMFSGAAAFDQNIASWGLDVQCGGGVRPEPRGLERPSLDGAPPRSCHLRRSCAHMPPSLRLVASQPAPRRPEYVIGRAALRRS